MAIISFNFQINWFRVPFKIIVAWNLMHKVYVKTVKNNVHLLSIRISERDIISELVDRAFSQKMLPTGSYYTYGWLIYI